jgi:AraC-like DNA-binding protein
MTLDQEGRSEPLPLAATGISGLGATARVVQGVSQEFRKLASAMPSLIAVREGTKTLRCGGASLEAHPGDMVVFPAHLAADVGNRVTRSGPYVAELLSFEPDFLLAHAAAHLAATPRQPLRQPALLAPPSEGLAQAFRAAVDALTADPLLPPAVVAHRLAEPLVWLGDLLNAVLLAPQTSMTARVRSILSGDPARNWSAGAVARRVGASAPTLRRKLAAESTGFAEILSDVRMSTALTLIQTTAAPISDVAAAVGYDSPSRFAVRFRRRFGMAPSAIRGHQRD